MTTREQIHQATDKYTDNANNFIEYSDDGGWSDKNDIEYVEKAFENGAEYGYNLALEKAVGWLCMNLTDNVYLGTSTHNYLKKEHVINGLAQAMKL